MNDDSCNPDLDTQPAPAADPPLAPMVTYGLLSEEQIHRKVNQIIGPISADLASVVFLFATSPERMRFILMKLNISRPENLDAQLHALVEYADANGPEKLLRRLNHDLWRAMREDRRTSATANDLYRALGED